LIGSRIEVLVVGFGCSFRNTVMHRKPIAIRNAVPKNG